MKQPNAPVRPSIPKPELSDAEFEELLLGDPRVREALRQADEHPERAVPYTDL
ncbi:hypothetical protein ACFQ07_25260 [Actinomadura adrarensis]|uniref:FXSXX-COOH protein n=1 Tax=Actinomadura adrarensis TaxID=1819600 RepID=A0ABW3CM41_9ACTN